MQRHHVSRTLPYRPEQLFALVGDVASYPLFVPWITGMRTWNARTLAPSVTALDAEATVGFTFLKERFATRVTKDAGGRTIDVTLLNGPFRKLVNRWEFHDHAGGGTRIEFDIEFAFKSRLLDALLRANFSPAVDRLMRCFEDRAAALYGPSATSATGRTTSN